MLQNAQIRVKRVKIFLEAAPETPQGEGKPLPHSPRSRLCQLPGTRCVLQNLLIWDSVIQEIS